MRDAFLRIQHQLPFSRFKHIYAETDTFYTFARFYRDWLEFETDIAELAQLTLVFCESPGSLAELGVFVSRPEIAANLLVLIDDLHNGARSFIVDGCLEYLTNKYGVASVHVLYRDDIQVESFGPHRVDLDTSRIDLGVFHTRLSAAIPPAIEAHGRRRRFQRGSYGHLAKLATGLIQHYGALTPLELECSFLYLGIEVAQERIDQLLSCTELFGWTRRDRRGSGLFHTAVASKMAIDYAVGHIGRPLRAVDWRLSVRDYWRKTDPERFLSIQSALRAS